MMVCNAAGTLVVPFRNQRIFGHAYASTDCTGLHWNDWIMLPDLPNLFVRGKKLHRVLNRWRSFAADVLGIAAFPVESLHCALFLQYLLDSTKSVSTTYFAFFAFKWLHDLAGVCSPTSGSSQRRSVPSCVLARQVP